MSTAAHRLLLGTAEGLLALRLDPATAGWTTADVLWRDRDVALLALDPDDPALILAAVAGDGFYRSEDGGRTWERYLDVRASALAVRPDRPELVYMGATDAEVLRSSDGGNHWTPLGLRRTRSALASPPERWGPVTALAIPPERGATVYAAVRDAGLLITFDGGRTWDEMSTVGLPSTVSALLIGPPLPEGTLLAATPEGLLRSEDRGFHWRADGVGIGEPVTTALGASQGRLLAAAAEKPTLRPDSPADAAAPANAGRLYHRPPSSSRWWPASEPLPGAVTSLATAPDDAPGRLAGTSYAVTDGGMLLAWRPGQRAFHMLSRGLPTARALVIAPPCP